ncbi:MAG: amino acid-binding protein [Desulfovibrio sp.]|nr:amino acid-binding protein [Desulfovibrio sp.]
MPLKQLSVFIENRPGSIAEVARLLRDNSIDMRALSLADARDYGILRIIVNDVYKSSTVFKNSGFIFKITPVVGVPLKDSAGGLADALDILGAAEINIEYLYAFTGKQESKAYVIFRFPDKDIERASRILAENGYSPITEEEL